MSICCGIFICVVLAAANEDATATQPDCTEQSAEAKASLTDKSKPVLTFDRNSVPAPDPTKGAPLARVFNEYVYLTELKAESAELTREQSEQLSGRIFTPLLQRFLKEHRLCATDEEILQFQTAMQFEPLSAEEREGLTPDEQREFEESMRKMAEMMVVGWKRDRALYERYGGIVIFQQGNPFEPVGAYRQFLEETEKAGVFEVFQADHRQTFWSYFVSSHRQFQIPAEDVNFSQPWWMLKPADESPM